MFTTTVLVLLCLYTARAAEQRPVSLLEALEEVESHFQELTSDSCSCSCSCESGYQSQDDMRALLKSITRTKNILLGKTNNTPMDISHDQAILESLLSAVEDTQLNLQHLLSSCTCECSCQNQLVDKDQHNDTALGNLLNSLAQEKESLEELISELKN